MLIANRSAEVIAATERVRVRLKRTVEDIIEIGKDLALIRESVSRAEFLSLIAEFEMGEDTAQNFINVARRFPKISDVQNLKPSVLYLLAAPSTPDTVVETVLEKVSRGEPVAVAEVKKLKQELAIAQRENSQLKMQSMLAETTFKELKANADIATAQLDQQLQSENERIEAAKAIAYEDAKKELTQEINTLTATLTAKEREIADIQQNPSPEMEVAIAQLKQEQRLLNRDIDDLINKRTEMEASLQSVNESRDILALARAFEKEAIALFEKYAELGLKPLPEMAVPVVQEGMDNLTQFCQHLDRNIPSKEQIANG